MPNLIPISILAAIVGSLLLLGTLEVILHRRTLAKLPIRVHVNGTRGKTSVVRLIAAGLRAGGLRVCAKTTGSLDRTAANIPSTARISPTSSSRCG